MPDIMIRGMEMPENCDKCIYSGWSNFYQIYVCNVVRKGNPLLFNGKQVKSTAIKRSGRAENCPLIALPEGHGRLVDADALEIVMDDKYTLGDCGRRERDDVVDALRHNAPTIVPAEREAET